MCDPADEYNNERACKNIDDHRLVIDIFLNDQLIEKDVSIKVLFIPYGKDRVASFYWSDLLAPYLPSPDSEIQTYQALSRDKADYNWDDTFYGHYITMIWNWNWYVSSHSGRYYAINFISPSIDQNLYRKRIKSNGSTLTWSSSPVQQRRITYNFFTPLVLWFFLIPH